jgi:hypothetical protein
LPDVSTAGAAPLPAAATATIPETARELPPEIP